LARLGIAISAPLPHSDLVRIARESESRGLDSFWLTEGLGKDAFAQLGALGSETKRIKLGTAIVSIYVRSAALTAMAAAALDDVTGGRFILGLGTGHKPATEKRHGLLFEKPLERMRDYVTIISQAVGGELVSHNGAAYSVKDLRLQFSAPGHRVPIYMAVLGLRMARLAGAMADGVIMHLATREHVVQVKKAIAEGALAVGRDPSDVDVACMVMCRGAVDEEKGWRELTSDIAYFGAMHFYRKILHDTGFQAEADGLRQAWRRNDAEGANQQVSARLLNELPIAVGSEHIGRKIAEFQQVGVDLPILYPATDLQGNSQTVLDALEAATRLP
jgi:5,10-methylenetetrahydromethanopterin reductase